MIQRKEYLQQLINQREEKIIKVVTGVRRCGKSTLFALYQNYLRETGVSNCQIISLNLEDIEYEELLDYKKLYKRIKEGLCEDKYTYIFLDEVQNCSNFEKVVDSLFLKENVDIYITGSNAYMLSGELATLLSGRYVKIDMLPLSYKEYVEINLKEDKSKQELFNEYLYFGSFPYLATSNKKERNRDSYLEGIYNTILIKDVAKREGITDITLLESIVKTMVASIGSPISIKKITDTIVSAGRKISVNSVDNYVKALCDSYIFYKVDRYDIKGRQYLKTLGKYYIVDTGIRNLLLSSSSMDLGHVIENIVYFQLLRCGYRVNIGKVAEKEVDFVASNIDGILYVQVSASVLDETTLKRELASLEAIPDHYPKILLTLDEVGRGSNFNGIKHMNLIDWLLDER
ncbi:MAG: ATP-binding protein [Eubacteriales bacterium]